MPLVMDDRFRNVLSAEVTLSAADTLTYQELNTGTGIGQGLGMVIDAIDYYPASGAMRELDADNDSIQMAFTTSDQATNLTDMSDRRIFDAVFVFNQLIGTAGNTWPHHTPIHREFTPPLLVASPRIFFGVDTGGFASAYTFQARMAFRFIKLSAQEYLEVAETFILLG